MKFFGVIPCNASQFFQVQFKDIQIHLERNLRPVYTGGFLRFVRRIAPSLALFIAAIFCLHCLKPVIRVWAGLGKKMIVDGINQIGENVVDTSFYQTGLASWYGGQHGSAKDDFEHRLTASGEIMDSQAMICAHKTLPFGTIVRVENLSNGRSTILRVVDRGPFIKGRIIDISMRAAKEIGILDQGVAQVRVQAYKGLVRTKYQPTNTRPDLAMMDSYLPLSITNVNIPALFLSLIDPIVLPKGYLRHTPLKQLAIAIQNLQDIINRTKKRRFEPFINRET
ncbi:MAG: septal ring lytic transglycosylase RlpA family protein [Holophagaceae bacterium]|nr:septal ring lytic transglycosylase RlpA family protein [Holophagaceae bacterium]